MFQSAQAKAIADEVRQNARRLVPALWYAVEGAIVGQRLEVQFFRALAANIQNQLQQQNIGSLNVGVRFAETHKKPIVQVLGPQAFRCELADLLVVVKYDLGGGRTERKSILYQVKLCDTGTTVCTIDQNQLTLLQGWPAFEFGRNAAGGPVRYQIDSTTLEFGSYMLMLRAPAAGSYVRPQWFPSGYCWAAYGISPYARAVQRNGPKQIDIAQFACAHDAVSLFFSHLGFESGEHHGFSPAVATLTDALYRNVGLAPDPPDEFEGYTREVGREEIGFGIIEIKVGRG